MGDSRRFVRVGPNTTAEVERPTALAGMVFFQLLPSDEWSACSPTPYRLAEGGVEFGGTTGEDGVIPLSMTVGGATTLDVSNTRYSLSLDPDPSPGADERLPNLVHDDLSWLRSENSRPCFGHPSSLAGISPSIERQRQRQRQRLPAELTSKLANWLARMPAFRSGWVGHGGIVHYRPDPASLHTVPFTTKELWSLDGLISRYEADRTGLNAAELQLLSEAVRIYVNGCPVNTILASSAEHETKVLWMAQMPYRLRITVSRTPAFGGGPDVGMDAGALARTVEAEVFATGGADGQTFRLACSRAAEDAPRVHDPASGIRWEGRFGVIDGLAYARPWTPPEPGKRPPIPPDEVDGPRRGFAPGTIAGAVCLGFGTHDRGGGVFACGVLRGISGPNPRPPHRPLPRQSPSLGHEAGSPRLRLRYEGQFPRPATPYAAEGAVRENMENLPPGATIDVTAAGLVAGRLRDADIKVYSPYVARRHARLSLVADGIAVEDLGSTNGTAINGLGVARGVLRRGDRLTLAGVYEFVVIAEGDA